MRNHIVATAWWIAQVLFIPGIALFTTRTRVTHGVPVTFRQVMLFFTPVNVPAHRLRPGEARRERLRLLHERGKTRASASLRPAGIYLAVPSLLVALIGSVSVTQLQSVTALADGRTVQQFTSSQPREILR